MVNMPAFLFLFGGLSTALGAVPQISSNIRSDYLQGHPIAVQLTFRNTDAQQIEIPNIESESWRVEFQITDAKGQTQTRSTRPDVYPAPSTWTIEPRQSRSVWISLPAGQGLKAGHYQIQLSIDLDKESHQSPEYQIEIQAPKPIKTHFDLLQHPLSRQSNPILWVHQASNGYSTYLHHSHVNKHTQALFHDFVLHTTEPIDPLLSIAQGATRHIVWQATPRRIHYLTLQHNIPRHNVQQLAIPWPAAEIVGSPVTAPDGTPQFLLWIPSPSKGGELRWCGVLDNGIPIYRKLTQLDQKPVSLSMSMNDQGEALIAVVNQGTVMLFTGIEASERPNIPLKSTALGEFKDPILDIQFSVHPEEGQVLYLLLHRNKTDLSQMSLTLSGEPLGELMLSETPYSDQPLLFSPHHSKPAVALLQSSDITLHIDGTSQRIKAPPFDWSLDRTQDGALWMVGSHHTRPSFSQKIWSETP